MNESGKLMDVRIDHFVHKGDLVNLDVWADEGLADAIRSVEGVISVVVRFHCYSVYVDKRYDWKAVERNIINALTPKPDLTPDQRYIACLEETLQAFADYEDPDSIHTTYERGRHAYASAARGVARTALARKKEFYG